MPVRHPTAAQAFLTAGNRMAIGCNLRRTYPVDQTPSFEQLLDDLRTADRLEPASSPAKQPLVSARPS